MSSFICFSFFRCHQSHLINLDHVVRFDKRDGGSLFLENERSIPVSPKKKNNYLKCLIRSDIMFRIPSAE